MGKRSDKTNRFAAERDVSSAGLTSGETTESVNNINSVHKEMSIPENKSTPMSESKKKTTKPSTPDKEPIAKNPTVKKEAEKKTVTKKRGSDKTDIMPEIENKETIKPVNNATKKPGAIPKKITISEQQNETISEQLERMGRQNSLKIPTTNACFSLDSNVLDGIKKAKDIYKLPLSRLVNTILKDFLDKNNIDF